MIQPDQGKAAMEQLLTVREVAILLRLHEKTVYALVARGAIPHVRLGRRVVFSQPELLRWLGSRMEGR